MGLRIIRHPRSSQGQPRGQTRRSTERMLERESKARKQARMKARTTGSKQTERTRTGMISKGKIKHAARKRSKK